MDEKLKEQNYVEELIEIIRSTKSNEELRDKLSDYHENDIADAFVRLDEEERKRLYPILGAEQVAEIFTYIDDPDLYLNELDLDKAARVISYMDSDDAVDVERHEQLEVWHAMLEYQELGLHRPQGRYEKHHACKEQRLLSAPV